MEKRLSIRQALEIEARLKENTIIFVNTIDRLFGDGGFLLRIYTIHINGLLELEHWVKFANKNRTNKALTVQVNEALAKAEKAHLRVKSAIHREQGVLRVCDAALKNYQDDLVLLIHFFGQNLQISSGYLQITDSVVMRMRKWIKKSAENLEAEKLEMGKFDRNFSHGQLTVIRKKIKISQRKLSRVGYGLNSQRRRMETAMEGPLLWDLGFFKAFGIWWTENRSARWLGRIDRAQRSVDRAAGSPGSGLFDELTVGFLALVAFVTYPMSVLFDLLRIYGGKNVIKDRELRLLMRELRTKLKETKRSARQSRRNPKDKSPGAS